MTRRIAKAMLAVILTACIILPVNTAPVMAGQNPSLQEIAKIFNRVAQEKNVPAEILQAIAFNESRWNQFTKSGQPIIGPGGYLGIMQVSTPTDPADANRLKNDIAFNIAYGAEMLKAKWDATPRIGDGDPAKLENWYFAIWAYHRWDSYNNPNVAKAYGRIPYQEKIFNLMSTEYIKGIISPVKPTLLPPSALPASGVPDRNSEFSTPQPVHYAAFSLGMPTLSRSQETELLASVPRIYGLDRIETALQIAAEGWPHGCETAIIARSDDFGDALCGIALAKAYNAPILLNPQAELDSKVKEALLDLKPLKIIILGGENAISAQVEQSLRETLDWTQDFERIAGNNRFETAALAASRFPSADGVAIVNGNALPDAISLAAAAAGKGYPLLLTDKDSLPEATVNALTQLPLTSAYLAGGEQVLSPEIASLVKDTAGLGDEQVLRLTGKDRYETSANILKTFYPQVEKMFVVNGTAYPDALAGAALAACQNAALLLLPPQGPTVGSDTEQYFQYLASANDYELKLSVIGGREAVTDRSILKIRYLLDTKI